MIIKVFDVPYTSKQVDQASIHYLIQLESTWLIGCCFTIKRELFFYFQIDPIEYVEKVAENMHLFAEEDILTGRSQFYHYDEEVYLWAGPSLICITPLVVSE